MKTKITVEKFRPVQHRLHYPGAFFGCDSGLARALVLLRPDPCLCVGLQRRVDRIRDLRSARLRLAPERAGTEGPARFELPLRVMNPAR